MNSARHRNITIQCPFCGMSAGTATGLVHHIERGCCSEYRMSRMCLYDAVRDYDYEELVSHYPLSGRGCDDYDPVFQPSSTSWNPIKQAFQCFICHRSFRNLSSLGRHLNSPTHLQSLYHCPKDTCPRQFATLAGLTNHLESESCGYMRFSDVQECMRLITNPSRWLSELLR